ncbi:hypothetical protein KAU51_02905 [Candidatus Parcubacteria bacterium]|nr:hypothetical protein [Candidatus Parcubacteria bacterium]
MGKKKIELEETSEEFKKNGCKFARCDCGRLIVIANGENIKQEIYAQIKGLKSNGYDPLTIANELSICCHEPNYRFLSLDFDEDEEWIFQEIREEFLSQSL